MIVTIIAGNTKWGWLERSYFDLKDNYNGVLDGQDIAMAVNNDAAFNNTKKEYKKVRLVISSIWIFAIIGMLVFTLIIGHNTKNSEAIPIKIGQTEEQMTDHPGTGTSETGMSENSRRCEQSIKKASVYAGLRTLKQYGTTRVRQNKLS